MRKLLASLAFLLASVSLIGAEQRIVSATILLQEADGSPSGKVNTIKVTNGTLAISGNVATLTTGGGGGGGGAADNLGTHISTRPLQMANNAIMTVSSISFNSAGTAKISSVTVEGTITSTSPLNIGGVLFNGAKGILQVDVNNNGSMDWEITGSSMSINPQGTYIKVSTGDIAVQDESSDIGSASRLNFTGAGVSAARSGDVISVTVNGGGAGGSDNLGTHVATQPLNMNNLPIDKISSMSITDLKMYNPWNTASYQQIVQASTDGVSFSARSGILTTNTSYFLAIDSATNPQYLWIGGSFTAINTIQTTNSVVAGTLIAPQITNLNNSTLAITNAILALSTETASGGGGGVQTLYLSTNVDTTNSNLYCLAFTTPSTFIEATKTASVATADGLVLVSSHSTLAGGLGRSVNTIPAGFWAYSIFAGIDSVVGQTDLVIGVSTLSKTGTNITNISSVTITNINATTPSLYSAESLILSDISISTDDRVLIQIFTKTTSALARTVTVAYGGTSRASRVGTTIERAPTFITLQDVPQSYLNQAGKFPRVAPGESSLIFVSLDTTSALTMASTNAAVLQSQIFTIVSTNSPSLATQISTNAAVLFSQHNAIVSTNSAHFTQIATSTGSLAQAISTNAAVLQSQINVIRASNVITTEAMTFGSATIKGSITSTSPVIFNGDTQLYSTDTLTMGRVVMTSFSSQTYIASFSTNNYFGSPYFNRFDSTGSWVILEYDLPKGFDTSIDPNFDFAIAQTTGVNPDPMYLNLAVSTPTAVGLTIGDNVWLSTVSVTLSSPTAAVPDRYKSNTTQVALTSWRTPITNARVMYVKAWWWNLAGSSDKWLSDLVFLIRRRT